MSYSLTVTESGGLTLGLTGPAGPAGPSGSAGSSGVINTSTATNLTGFISGNGTSISGATAAATAGTASTLVLRSAQGGASFDGVTATAVSGTSITGTGGRFESNQSIGAFIKSESGLGALIFSETGTHLDVGPSKLVVANNGNTTINGSLSANSLVITSTPLPITSGGTGATSASGARDSLGVSALTFAGTDPNGSSTAFASGSPLVVLSGVNLIVSGIVSPAGANGTYTPTGGTGSLGKPNYVKGDFGIVSSLFGESPQPSLWLIVAPLGLPFPSAPSAVAFYSGVNNADATPANASVWTANALIPSVVIPPLTATHLGQLCKTPTAWWRWDGDVWEEDVSITGNQTITGEKTFDDNVTFNANINAANIYGVLFGSIVGNIQSLSGAGAVDPTLLTTLLTTTGPSQAITLGNGDAGQIKTIIHDVDGGSAVLTPATKTGFTTITFTAAGETATLQFVATRGWMILSLRGAVAA